ncbi:hypothetical protein OROHE_024540 [Orobanche hederae]
MAFKINIPLIFLQHTIFFLQATASQGNLHNDPRKSLLLQNNPELNIFFHYNTLKLGSKLPLYFPKRDPSNSPHLLSRHESDPIPFSLSRFSDILKLFSLSGTSKQALAMRTTLHQCESSPVEGETRFCATSIESMLDSVRGVFGSGSRFRVVTTDYYYLSSSSSSSPPLQNYTVVEPPAEILARKIVACHVLPYPYVVFYCHGQEGDSKLYKVLLAGDDGRRVEAAAICHMDTKEWDPNHTAFRVLGVGPGGPPVCHFFPMDNLIWIPKVLN